jgi:hypothetical protein
MGPNLSRARPVRSKVHINPDHFLQTPEGRITTPERNAEAWAKCYVALHDALAVATASTKLYVLVGAQGSGKSAWARQRAKEEPEAVFFDAILVKRAERAPILAAARRYSVPATAVWLQTPLEICLRRNAARPVDEVADEQGLRNVFAALEPPDESEGFAEVIELPIGG